MSVFHLEISEHMGQFGDTTTAERAVLIGLLQQAAQKIGSGHPIGTKEEPYPLILAGQQVGHFFAGDDSHTLQGR